MTSYHMTSMPHDVIGGTEHMSLGYMCFIGLKLLLWRPVNAILIEKDQYK